jgi:ATP-dependent RNA helicase DDX46/PRP5
MARYGSRSRSPSRSNGYSKRARDDRYDPRGSRLRSRSRDVGVHPSTHAASASLNQGLGQRRDYRDRGGRRDRSTDRRRRDDHYDPRDDRRRDDRDRPREKDRDRSRDRRSERRRSRSRDSARGDRSRRDRDRDRDRDADRERGGEGRRDEPRRDRGREVGHIDLHGSCSRADSDPKSPALAAQSEEEKIRQRRERLDAWKKKKAEEEAQKKAASPAAILSELERQRTATASLTTSELVQGAPKVPAQQATSSASLSNSNTPRPKADQGSPVPTSTPLGMPLHVPAFNSSPLTLKGPANGSALPTNRPVSTFGFGAKKIADKGKRTLDFGEEESAKKKLERLPSPIPGETDANGAAHEDVDDDTEMQDATEEESAAAARAAAEQRKERADAAALESTTAMEVEPSVPRDVEEADPLDAFMAGISNSVAKESAIANKPSEDAQLFGDDEVDLVASEQDPDDILAMAAKLKKKKELPTVNHAKMNYEPFRKDFYVEPVELAEMTEKEVDELRLELDGIKIRGQDVPKPVVKWSQCGLPAQSLNVIQNLGYEKPTSIQAQAIPAIMSGRNVIGVAKTGSGKTIAFLLPMFRHIKDQRPLDSQDGPISLVMTPTRELAVQIFKECKPFLKALNLRVRAFLPRLIMSSLLTVNRLSVLMVVLP